MATQSKRIRPDLLTACIETLSDKGSMSIGELAHALKLSERQVARYVKQLHEQGELHKSKQGRLVRYTIPEEHRSLTRHTISLTEEELLALTIAAEASRGLIAPTPYAKPFGELLRRLIDIYRDEIMHFEPEDKYVHFSSPELLPFNEKTFQTILDAIREVCTLEIEYFAASSGTQGKRLIDPYILSVPAGNWMVTAYCHKSKMIKDFAIPRIRAATKGEPFIRREFDPAKHARKRFKALGGAQEYTVKLRFDHAVAHLFREKRYHVSQNIEETEADGGLVVSYTVSGLDDIASWVLSWGTNVIALEPEELREGIWEEAKAIANRYGSE